MSDPLFAKVTEMSPKAQSKLAARRESFRLWYEYLRLAKKSTDRKVVEALKRSAAFYEPWGDVESEKFDAWWKRAGHLFEERYAVRKLELNEQPSDTTSLVVEIPLNKSPTRLTRIVKAIIEEAWARQNKERKRKNKTIASATYHLTEGAEPKLLAVREMLTVYRDVYFKNRNLRGEALLDKIHIFYRGRKNKRWAKVPVPLLPDPDGDTARAQRNMRRYIDKAEKVMLNVANGQFPGEY